MQYFCVLYLLHSDISNTDITVQRAPDPAVTFMASLSSRTSGWVNISVAVFAAIDKALVSLMSDQH